MVSLDIIMSVAFEVAQGDSTLAKQVANWKTESTPTPRLTAEKLEEPCPFPSAELDPEWQACVYLTESIAVAFRARQPRIAHWLYLQRPHSRRMLRLKDRLIARNIEAGKKRLEEYRKCHAQPKETPNFKHMKLKCAVDQILLREMAAAEKLRVQPNFHKRAIYDEVSIVPTINNDSSRRQSAIRIHHRRTRHHLIYTSMVGEVRSSVPAVAVSSPRCPVRSALDCSI